MATLGNSLFFLGSRLGDSLLVQFSCGIGASALPHGMKEEVSIWSQCLTLLLSFIYSVLLQLFLWLTFLSRISKEIIFRTQLFPLSIYIFRLRILKEISRQQRGYGDHLLMRYWKWLMGRSFPYMVQVQVMHSQHRLSIFSSRIHVFYFWSFMVSQ